MKIEAGKFYILNNGQLAKMFIENGLGQMLGAIRDDGDGDGPWWEAFTWEIGTGRFNKGRAGSLDLCEKIDARASQVSYAKQFDYCATYDNDEPDDDGNMRQGFGATELEAVMDLLQAYPGEERAEMMRAA